MLRFKTFITEASLQKGDIRKQSPNNPAKTRAQDLYDKIQRGEPVETAPDSRFNGQNLELEFIDSEIERIFREGDVDNLPKSTEYFRVKSNPEQTVRLTELQKTKEFGSSRGSGGGQESKNNQENLHALFYSYVLNVRQGTFEMGDFDTADLEKAFRYVQTNEQSLERMLQYPEYFDEGWMESIIKSANAYWQWFNSTRNASGPFIVHRESPFFNNLYKKFRELRKKQGLKMSDDKWNPGDIWVSNSKGEGILSEKFTSLADMNRLVSEYYMSGDLVAVSLKRIQGQPSVDEYNTENAKAKKAELRYASLHGPRGDQSFFNNVKLYVFSKDKRKAEFRAFDRDQSFQAQLMGDAAAGGKIGYGPINDVLKMVGVEELPNARNVTRSARKADDRLLRDFYSYFTQYAKGDERRMDEDEFINHVKSFEEEFRSSFLFSKYLATRMFHIFERNPDKRDEILDGMFTYAASATKFSSPFVKIS